MEIQLNLIYFMHETSTLVFSGFCFLSFEAWAIFDFKHLSIFFDTLIYLAIYFPFVYT